MQTVFIEGRSIYLRPVERDDLPRIVRWLNDPDIRRFTSHYRPLDLLAQERWFDALDRGRPASDTVFMIVLRPEAGADPGRDIGITTLNEINWRERSAVTGTLLGEKDCWGRGLGTESKRLLLAYAFDELGLHRVTSHVIAMNERSLKSLLSCGYTLEGRMREAFFREGKWEDDLVYGILAHEWRAQRDSAGSPPSARTGGPPEDAG